RPQGLTIQGHAPSLFMGAGAGTATVSVRDAKRLPVVEALVGHFYYLVDEDANDAFDDDGKCNLNSDDLDNPVKPNCNIGVEFTGLEGNLVVDLNDGIDDEDGTVMVYFWNGQDGATFDKDENTHTIEEITVSKAATRLHVTSSHGGDSTGGDDNTLGTMDDGSDPEGEIAEFGETATVTIQLQDGEGDNAKPVADKDVKVRVQIFKDLDGSTESSNSIEETDESGKIEFSFTKEDPDTDKGNTGHVIVAVYYTEAIGTHSPNDRAGSIRIDWADQDEVATSIDLTSKTKYVKLPDEPNKTLSVRVEAEVLDQYGDPADNEVFLLSNYPNSHRPSSLTQGFPVVYTTGDSETGAVQSFGVYWVTSLVGTNADTPAPDNDTIKGKGITGDTRGTAAPNTTTPALTVYWAVEESAIAPQTDLTIVAANTDENTIVVSSSPTDVKYADYDSGDQFSITDSDGTRAVLMDTFEEELDTEHSIDWTVSDNGVSTFTLDIT
ncbi:MAG: hypothetical protein OXI63_16185, partial [Candidatus Poribacteria bacterium]|nr:hypothetical protein [Candidatus Poribacteria bacterium]